MKLYGSLSRLVSVMFRKDSQDLTLRPNQSTTYTASRDFQLPAGDAAHVLVSASSASTFTNKTFDANGSGNSISNLEEADFQTKAGDADKVLLRDGSGVVSSAKIADANVASGAAIAYAKLALSGSIVNADINASAAIAYSKLALSNSIVNADINASAAIAYSKLNLSASVVNADIASAAAIDASKIADGSVSSTEFQYINSLSSNAQDQIDSKASKALDNLTVAGLDAEYLLVGASSSAVSALAPGSEGQVLAIVSGAVAWEDAPSSVFSFKATWLLADGATKSITHSLGSTDVMVQIFDSVSGQSIEVDSITRTDANTVDLSASEAPGVSWRVLILAV